MLQVRKLVLAVAAATAMTSGVAHALGLGEVTVKSALDQPLLAEIELLETKGLGADEIRSRLASAEEFSLAGVDRPFFLTNLKFTPVIRGGRNFVRITSDQAVREPFLNFLVEVYWPNGRLLKEYTVLLDPPMYTPQQVVYSAPAATTRPAAAAAAQPQPARSSQPARTQRLPAAGTAARPALKDGEYQVRKNDTLWEIALRAGQGSSVHQTMLAIQDLNPDAFVDGNINRLKSGQVLKLPTAEQIRQRSLKSAVAEVQAQEQAWRTGAKPERQLDARERSTADAAPAEAAPQDNLRLVAADTGESTIGSDQGNSAALQDKLAQTQEQLDSAVRENQDLNSRVEELNSQLEKLQRLVELKNDQLASLQNFEAESQATLEEPQPELQSGPEAVADEQAPAEVGMAAEQTADESLVDDDFSIAGEEPAIEPLAEPVAEPTIEELIAEELRQQELAEEQQAEVADTLVEAEPAEPQHIEAEEAAPAEDDTQPVQVQAANEAPVEQRSFLEDLLANPMFLPAAGAGAAALLLLLLLARRRAQGKADKEPEEQQGFSAVVDDEPVPGLDEAFPDDDLGATPAAVPEFAGDADSHDPIAEAENYISYGRFSQASQVLLAAIDQEPHREDLRIKLLEVFADLEDQNSFSAQFEELVAMGTPAETLDTIRQRYPHLLEVAAPELPELPGFDAVDTPSGLPELPEDDFLAEGFSELDDLLGGQSADGQAQPLDEAADTADVLEIPDFELPEIDDRDKPLDFVLDDFKVDETAAEETVAEAAPADGGDDDLLLDMDFDLSLPVDEAAAAPVAEETSVLDLDLDAELQSVSSELDAVLDDAEELSLDGLDLPEPLADPADVAGLDLDLDLDALLAGSDRPEAATGTTDASEALAALDDFSFDLDTPELPAAAALSDADLSTVSALEQDLGDDLDFLSGTDETTTKLDLAQALSDMGDVEGARDILEEVVNEGNPEQQQQARDMLGNLS